MILQELKNYYDRKAADLDSGIAPEGFEIRAIPYIIVIDDEGCFVNLEFTGDASLNKNGRQFIVPMWQQKSGTNSGATTNLFWDHYGYVLAWPKSEIIKDKDQAKKQHSSFIHMIECVNKIIPNNKEILAVLRFYANSGVEKVIAHEEWNNAKKRLRCNLSFRLNSRTGLIFEFPELLSIANRWNGKNFSVTDGRIDHLKGICLVTGEPSSISRLHRPITGVNAKPSPMLSVNNTESQSFSSFCKSQGENFPVGNEAAFKYATALNFLLKKNSNQKMRIGDDVIIFWSSKLSHIEHEFRDLFDEPLKDNPDRLTNAVRALYKSVDTGVISVEDSQAHFFVLGLSPNAARISVRFWNVGTVAEFSQKIIQHFHDLELVHAPSQKEHLSLKALLCSIAVQEKSRNILPNISSDWMRCILSGLPYPDSLYQAALRRIRAERKVSYPRAKILKAYLNRKARSQNQSEKEMNVSLDKDNQNPGYRLGRLFATLEKIQEEAQIGITATIRDRYYSAASGTPASVMPTLMRLKNHHLANPKLEVGRHIYFERLIGEIVGEITDFPSQLNLQDQGRFAIGYYHQRQAFFKKSEIKEE